MKNQTSSHTSLNSLKFHIPSVSQNQVSRDQLIQRLQTGLTLGHGLTLVSAPAGYGKSALIVEWLRQVKTAVSWLTLDEADDDPLRFFLYFVTALQKLRPSIGAELLGVIHSGHLPPVDTLVNVLVNELLTSQSALVLVLDDFQHIQDKTILEVIHAILAHELVSLHIVLITREDPALPLGRMRSRNQLTEMRASDLRFSKAEINTLFLKVMQFNLSESDLLVLEQRTEGWAAGLQLVGLSMQGRQDLSHFVTTLNGNHRFILSYLTEEVLNRQPQSVQKFLMQNSILSSLTGDLCDALTQQTNSAEVLETLYSDNLFIIPLDDEQRWYRFHPLFADLLHSQLKQTNPEEIKALHQRASTWYESNQMPMDAIEHALMAKDFQRVITLLEQHNLTLLNQGYIRRVESWIHSIPEEWQSKSPRTSLRFAWIHLLRGNPVQVNLYLKQARGALADQGETQETNDLRAECYALESNLQQTEGNIPEAITAGEQALRWVAAENDRVKGLAYLGLGASYRQALNFEKALDTFHQAIHFSQIADDLVSGMLATTHLVLMCHQHGRLHLAERYASQAIEWMEQSNIVPPPIVGAVYGSLGLVYYEWNQLEKAREYFLRGIQSGTFSGHNASLIYTKLNLSLIQKAEGDMDSARLALQEAEQIFRRGAPGWLRPNLIYRQVQMAVADHNLDEAEALLQASDVHPVGPINNAMFEIYLAKVCLLRARKKESDLNQAMDLLERLRTETEKQSLTGVTLQVLLQGAQLFALKEDFNKSLTWLSEALIIAEPEGYFRIFLDEGPTMAELLKKIPDSPYAQKLLAGFPEFTVDLNHRDAEAGLIDPLSEREMEVLTLLSQGLTYAEIAQTLIVSVNTVRYHVKGIYGKLNVDKQARAIEKARTLKLL